MSLTSAYAIIGVGEALMTATLSGTVVLAWARSPLGVMKRLSAQERYTVRVRNTHGTWNPARPVGSGNLLKGSGTATYQRETNPDGDVVHLTFTPKHGPAQHLQGPVPSETVPDTDENRRARAARLVLFLGALALVVMGLLGAWVGLLVTRGRPDSDRVAAALVGWAAAKVACWLAMLAVLVVRAWRDTLRGMRTGDP